ncbi:MAG: hypothetical protein J6X28_01190 [Bacilli bacterium]|nr:hypothetical protein [Bacilli bacterium]
MNKKIWLLLCIIPLLLITTACDNTHTGKEKDKKITKTIELSDSKLGFTTTFTYPADEKYTDVEEESGGASNKITFKNEDLDVTFEMYYTTMRTETYNETEKTRSAQKYYKEYTFGDYEAYAYGEYDDNIKLNILLGIDEDNTAEVLFVTIDRIDTDEKVIVLKVLESKLQDFFNSMEFVKE